MPVVHRTRRLVGLSVALGGLAAAGLVAAGPAPAEDRADPSQVRAAAPALLLATSARGESLPRPRAVSGESTLVTLRTSVLPRRADGQPIRFDLGRKSVTGRFTHIERNPSYTAWTGTLDVDLGSFTIVRSGSHYRASLTWPQGLWAVTQADGSRYWLTEVAPYAGRSGADGVGESTATPAGPAGPAIRAAHRAADRKKGGSRIDVLFAYTSSAKRAAGSKAGLKAAVGQAAADTNTALRNSGIKAKIRVKGIVRVKGKESNNVVKDVKRLLRPRDGRFDSALKARGKRHADIVHLFTGGPADRMCGAGAQPISLRSAVPSHGASSSYISCLPYLVATHELGHNLGADHISYPGVSHQSKFPDAYGWYDVPHHFITVMGYYDPCQDVGDFTCVRIPWFSNPKGSYAGFPIGSKDANNAKVIKRIAPIVARYSR